MSPEGPRARDPSGDGRETPARRCGGIAVCRARPSPCATRRTPSLPTSPRPSSRWPRRPRPPTGRSRCRSSSACPCASREHDGVDHLLALGRRRAARRLRPVARRARDPRRPSSSWRPAAPPVGRGHRAARGPARRHARVEPRDGTRQPTRADAFARAIGLVPVRSLHVMGRSLRDGPAVAGRRRSTRGMPSAPSSPDVTRTRGWPSTPRRSRTTRSRGRCAAADLDQRMAEPWWDPAGLILVVDGGTTPTRSPPPLDEGRPSRGRRRRGLRRRRLPGPAGRGPRPGGHRAGPRPPRSAAWTRRRALRRRGQRRSRAHLRRPWGSPTSRCTASSPGRRRPARRAPRAPWPAPSAETRLHPRESTCSVPRWAHEHRQPQPPPTSTSRIRPGNGPTDEHRRRPSPRSRRAGGRAAEVSSFTSTVPHPAGSRAGAATAGSSAPGAGRSDAARTTCPPTAISSASCRGCSSTSGCSSSPWTPPCRCSNGPASSRSSRTTSTSTSWCGSPASSDASPRDWRSAPRPGSSRATCIERIARLAHELMHQHAVVFQHDVRPSLEDEGITIVRWDDLDERRAGAAPLLLRRPRLPRAHTPRGRPGPPVPLHLRAVPQPRGAAPEPEDRQRALRAASRCRRACPRFIRVEEDRETEGVERKRFVPLEEVIAAHLDQLFPGMDVLEHFSFRVTRNEDLEVEEDDAENLLTALEKELTRRRFGPPIRLEVEEDMDPKVLDMLSPRAADQRPRDLPPADAARPRRPVHLTDVDRSRPRVPEVLPADPSRLRPDRERQGERPARGGAPEGRARPAPVQLVLDVGAGLHRAGRGRSAGARDQADPLSDVGGLPHHRCPHRCRRGGQAGARRRRDQGPVRRGQQHLVGPQARGGGRPRRLRRRRPQDPRQAVPRRARGARGARSATATSAPATTTRRPHASTRTSASSPTDPQVGEDLSRLFNLLSGFAPRSRFKRLLVAPRTVRTGLDRPHRGGGRAPRKRAARVPRPAGSSSRPTRSSTRSSSTRSIARAWPASTSTSGCAASAPCAPASRACPRTSGSARSSGASSSTRGSSGSTTAATRRSTSAAPT